MDEKYIKLLEKQNKLMRLIASLMVVIFVIVAVSVAIIVPKFNKALNETTAAVTKMDTIVSQLEEADLPSLVKDTKTLVEQSNTGVSEAVIKLNEIDIQALNDAIVGLKSVVEPLAKLFGHN